MGIAASMLWWEDEFCTGLAAGGRFVIRYDHRDTGQSVSYPPGKPGYTGADLAADAVGIQVALAHPERVGSLVLMSTSPAVPCGSELPPMSEELRAWFAAEVPDWNERGAVIDYLTAYERHLGGPDYFDEPHVRA